MDCVQNGFVIYMLKFMRVDIPSISKQLSEEQVFQSINKNFAQLNNHWFNFQMEWLRGAYSSFKDQDKYLIIIYLVNKTMNFFSRSFIVLDYDSYYLKSKIEISNFNIINISKDLLITKETARRKVLELEKLGVLKRQKKQIIIDQFAFNLVKPENQIKFTSKYIYLVSLGLNNNNNYSLKLNPKLIENIIRKRFSLCWRWFYRMQVPLVIGYDNFMQDLSTFHIWGTVCMNQVLNASKELDINTAPLDHWKMSKIIIDNVGSNIGLSAMSISDMTNIPRPTVVRKCKYLLKQDFLKLNDKKQYELSSLNFKKVLPYQKEVFWYKAKFIRKILNLLVIS